MSCNHLGNGLNESMNKLIYKLFNLIMISGNMPNNFNTSIIVPIKKNKKIKTFELNNLRPISISNSLSQIFERIILDKSSELLKTNNLQFGYKKNISTTIPITIINESINICKNECTPLFVASIDAEKAFDRIWRVGLFYKLKPLIHPRIWFILFEYYKSSKGLVKYKNKLCGPLFSIFSGVKQGGVLSPFLFNVFIEELIEKIKFLNIGVNLYGIVVPLLAFCDDIILMSNAQSELQTILNECSTFSYNWNYKFNPRKSYIMNCSKNYISNEDIKITLNNEYLNVVDEIKYLGLYINNKLDYDKFILNKLKLVQKSFFSLYNFGLKPNGLNPNTQAFLYKTYCLSKATYALGCIRLSSSTIKAINIIQNNLIRFSLGLQKYTHISIINKCLKIYDTKTLLLINTCIQLAILHRHDITKHLLEHFSLNQEDEYGSKSFIKNLKDISVVTDKNLDYIINFPGIIKAEIHNTYYSVGNDDLEFEFINDLLKNYNFFNKRILKNTCNVQLNSTIITN